MRRVFVLYLLIGWAMSLTGQQRVPEGDLALMNAFLQGESEAIALAHSTIEKYALNSRLFSDEGEDLSREFLALFGIDSKIPQDYFRDEEGEELTSPSKYVSDYLSVTDAQPFPVVTRILSDRTTVSDIGNSGSKRVRVVIERTFSSLIVDGTLSGLKRLIRRRMEVMLIVRPLGHVEIDGIRLMDMFDSFDWVVDLDYGLPLSNTGFSEKYASTVSGSGSAGVTVRSIGSNVSRRLHPFKGEGVLGARASILLGLGLKRMSFSTPSLDMSAEEIDYIQEDDVILLATGVSISDEIGSQDFVRQVDVSFEQHDFAYTAIEFVAAVSFFLADNGIYNTAVDLGGGLRIGGQNETEVGRVSAYRVTYAEGPFETVPVMIDEQGVYYGTLFEPYADPYGIFAVTDDANRISYTSQFATTPFLDLRIIESMDLRTTDLGVLFSIRHYLGDLVDRDGTDVSIGKAAREGTPPAIAFSDKIAPTLLTIGLRLNF